MAQQTYLICDKCNAAGHSASVGEGNVFAVDIIIDKPEKAYFLADLCRECFDELMTNVGSFLRPA